MIRRRRDREFNNFEPSNYSHEFDYDNDFSAQNDSEDESNEQKVSAYYAQRRLQKNQMERNIRKSQMWLRRLQLFVRLGTLILLIFVGYKLLKLPQWYLDKNIFNSLNSTSLDIMNNKIVPSYKILSALRKTELPHTPIYRMETDEIKQNILQLDPVDDVYVRRFWFPARLEIIVQEKVPVIIISPALNAPPVAFFTKDGKLIGREYMPLPKGFKTTLVLSYGTRGDDYRHWNYEKISLLDKIAKTVEANSNERVEYIDCRNIHDVFVKVKTANIRLGEIDDDVFERINRIPSILPQVKTLDKKIKYVDLRWKDANYIKLG